MRKKLKEIFNFKKFILSPSTVSGTWLDQNLGLKAENHLLRSVLLILILGMILSATTSIVFGFQLLKGINSQRLILVPGIHRKLVVPAEAFLSDTYIKAVSKRVVELLEQWTYESIQDSYQELFKDYYDHGLTQLTKANLMSSNFIQKVIDNKMVSTFQFDWKRSDFKWCEQIQRACAIVVGKRRLYLNHNEPFAEKEVAYLIVSSGVYPDENNPFAIRMTRLKVDDSSESPYMNIKAQFDSALSGVLPDANNK